MKKTVFNFSYETNPVEEVIVEPTKVLPNSLLEAFDDKIACFTNAVPLDELSASTLASHSKKRFSQADLTDNEYKKDALIVKGNKSAGRKYFSPEKVSEESQLQPQKHTAHLVDTAGKKTKISKVCYSHKPLSANAADFDNHIHGEKFRQKMTHITNASGKTVWTNPTVKESVEHLDEMSKDKYDAVAKRAKGNLEALLVGKDDEALGIKTKSGSHISKVNKSFSVLKQAKEKSAEAKAIADAKHSGYHQESVKTDTNKVDPDFVGDDEFSKDFDSKIKKNLMPRLKKIEPMEKPDSSNKKTEADASSDHGPNINQEPMHKFAKKGTAMESVNFTYKELLDIFSESELKESVLENAWDIEVYSEDGIHKFLVKDGDDIIAEGTNLTMKSAAKSAYRKCLQLESHVVSKVEQPSRVLNVIKSLNK